MPIYKYYTAQGCLAQGFTVLIYKIKYLCLCNANLKNSYQSYMNERWLPGFIWCVFINSLKDKKVLKNYASFKSRTKNQQFLYSILGPCNVENLLISHSDKVNDEISTWVLNCSQASIIHVLKLEADFLAKSTLDTTKKISERARFVFLENSLIWRQWLEALHFGT